MTPKISSHHIRPGRFAIHLTRQSTAFRSLITFVFLASFVLATFGSFASSRATQTRQNSWIGDIPIMADLSVEPALGFAFDSPNGRVVMIFASSTANAADILEFYNVSLAAIGWVGGDGEWRRGPEKLLISEVSTAAGRLWQLMVRPH